MLALQITSMKAFMNQLLAGDAFDIFLLEEAVISTANTYTIDGHMNMDFYPPEERDTAHVPYEFQSWSEIKGMCFHLIKGKHTPVFFKFVLHLKPEQTASLLQKESSEIKPEQIKALVLTIRYDGTKATLTTATAYHTFVMSKEADILWDKALTKYLSAKGVSFELL